jgi:hypothetical protein
MRACLVALLLTLPMGLVGCGGSGGTDDMMMSPADGSSADGGAAFGAACTMNSDCASNVCFVGGMRSFCSMHCTMATVSTDCPMPPTTGVCNMMGYCK